MKIILLKDIKGVGKKFELKEVKNGYAKNFLIPGNLAKAATETNLEVLTQQKVIWERQEKETIEHLEKFAKELEDTVLDFSLKVGEGRQTFGSVNASVIQKAIENSETLKKFSKEIKKIKVLLEKPIKELGEYKIKIDFGKGIVSEVKVKVRSQS